MSQKIPYGFWPSSINTDYLTSQSLGYSEAKVYKDKIFWLETRPNEKGRSVLVCYENEQAVDVLPSSISVRTRAQEYGGSCYCLAENAIYFVDDRDQAIYQLQFVNQQIQRISPEGRFRYADLMIDRLHGKLITVRESFQEDTETKSDIVAIDIIDKTIHLLATGNDFYSNPQLSPCGNYLSYLSWNHPQMPWDGSCCYVSHINSAGEPISTQKISGSISESIFQPQWAPSGKLYFVSDSTNWWNIYEWDGKIARCVYQMNAEFATPQWVFGMSTYGFLNDHDIFCCYTQNGQWKLAVINTLTNDFIPISQDFCDINSVSTFENRAVFIASSAFDSNRIFLFKENCIQAVTESTQHLSTDDIAIARPITFPARDGDQAYGFYYPPTNKAFQFIGEEKPPVIILCHGGPTGACATGFNIKIQFWTHRGFAVIDVNYRGSTGYGRHYRDSLKNAWGIKDVEDVCGAVEYAVVQGWIDSRKAIIRGSSAGGFTALAALTFTDCFALGCSLYGIGDLEALVKDTHKFESRYMDTLVGAYPENRERYLQRSPIHHIEKLNCPVIFFQGLKDKVVPPAQAESMVNALRQKNIEVEYVTFVEEGHGFRQADNVKRLYEKELEFYQRFLARKFIQ